MAGEYQSSEEFQRHKLSAGVFEIDGKAPEAPEIKSVDKVKKVLDAYIKKHSNTKDVRDMAKANDRTAEEQLNLSADLVEILEKIKSELR